MDRQTLAQIRYTSLNFKTKWACNQFTVNLECLPLEFQIIFIYFSRYVRATYGQTDFGKNWIKMECRMSCYFQVSTNLYDP